jgi:P63C domain
MGKQNKMHEHAREMAKAGAALGGHARADTLSAAERSEIARHAAQARWDRDSGLIPQATHVGTIKIGEKEIACAVLENGKRLLTQETFLEAVGRARKARGGRGSVRLADGKQEGLPPFLSPNLGPYIDDQLMAASPIVFRTPRGVKAYGYEAELLPKVCEVYLKARDDDSLLPNQEHIARSADILMRGLAHVGIIALVDEATGYQDWRARDELNLILERYIAEELRPWTRHFPNDFFKEIYRLHGWQYKPGSTHRPQYVGKLINDLVYKQLPPGVLEKLQEVNPVTDKEYRRHKHFQFLTEETGDPHLDKQIASVTTLMRASDDKDMFQRLFGKAFSKNPQQLVMFPDEADD